MSDLSARFQNLTPLQRAAYALKETQNRLSALQSKQREPIAIIGISCRFPDSISDSEALWQYLVEGRCARSVVPPDRWDAEAYYDADPTAPGKMVTKWGCFLESAGDFDNHFFGMSDREALVCDPQHRLLLELTWEAMEDAGLLPSEHRGSDSSVFVALGMNEYLSRVMHFAGSGSAYASIGNSSAAAANRISYAFDFRGPSLAVDTACSSALVAIHQACRALRAEETSLAIVGAANLQINPLTTINLTKSGVCSPDGVLRSFDEEANGFVRGDGAAVVVLKRLSDAIAAGDRVDAVILGGSVNHNGGSNGLSAPRRETQEAVMTQACKNAGISPSKVGYVEAHATGTPIGDAIEVAALNNVYGNDRSAPLKIGAIKPNLGHVEAASGMAGLLKCILALKHRSIPPTLHYRRPHPDSVLSKAALRVVTELTPFDAETMQPVVAVSSFGFGGANAHVLLSVPNATKEVAESTQPSASNSAQVFVMSARTESSLRDYAKKMAAYLRQTNERWHDICWTAAMKRDSLECRLAIVADDPKVAAEELQKFLDGGPSANVIAGRTQIEASDATSSTKHETSESTAHQVAANFVAGNAHWRSIFGQRGKFVSLPTYAWHHTRFWIDPTNSPQMQPNANSALFKDSSSNVHSRPELNVEYIAPRDKLETWIAAQWAEVLRLDKVGVKDNFFELGGDSLQAAGLLNRLQSITHETIHVMALFESPDIQSLASFLRTNHPNVVAKLEEKAVGTETPTSSVGSTSANDGLIPRRPKSATSIPARRESRSVESMQQMDDAAIDELLRRKLLPQQPTQKTNG